MPGDLAILLVTAAIVPVVVAPIFAALLASLVPALVFVIVAIVARLSLALVIITWVLDVAWDITLGIKRINTLIIREPVLHRLGKDIPERILEVVIR